jgi:hypothetical protein
MREETRITGRGRRASMQAIGSETCCHRQAGIGPRAPAADAASLGIHRFHPNQELEPKQELER